MTYDKVETPVQPANIFKSTSSSSQASIQSVKSAKQTQSTDHVKKCHAHENPQFQSTQLEQSTMNSFYTTAIFNETVTTEQQNKISSTFMPNVQPFQLEYAEPNLSLIDDEHAEEKETSRAFSNVYYTSPILSRSVSITSSSSASLSFTSDMFSEPTDFPAQSFECDSIQFKAVNGSFFNTTPPAASTESPLYVCVLAYQAQFEGDLSIGFAERVKILHSVNSEFALVKNISTNKCGYVPNKCLSTLTEFLDEIVRNCHNL